MEKNHCVDPLALLHLNRIKQSACGCALSEPDAHYMHRASDSTIYLL